jgi:hypothetical protein
VVFIGFASPAEDGLSHDPGRRLKWALWLVHVTVLDATAPLSTEGKGDDRASAQVGAVRTCFSTAGRALSVDHQSLSRLFSAKPDGHALFSFHELKS